MKFRTLILALMVCLVTNVFSQDVKELNKKNIRLSTGINMTYLEAGSAQGTPVILLHGLTDTSRSFFDTMNTLASLNPSLKIYALDQRGHGGSTMPEIECAQNPEICFSPAAFAKDVIAFMDQMGISKSYIVGHSMGSINAQEIALEYSHRVMGMVLIGSFVNGQTSAAINDYLIGNIIDGLWRAALEKGPGFKWPTDAYLLKPTELDPELTKWIKTDWVADPISNPELLDAIYPETMDIRLGVWIGALYGLRNVNNTERLKKLSVPTLVLWATQDNAFPKSDQNELKAALQKSVTCNNMTYVYKTYGRRPLPESGIQENDLGHNLQWAAFASVAEDINTFILTGKPTADLTYVDSETGQLLSQKR